MNTSLYSVMVHLHSVGRWIVLLLLLFAIINSLLAGRRPFIRSDNRLGLLLTIFADTMLLIGIYLYFAGPLGYKQFAAFNSFGEKPVRPFFCCGASGGNVAGHHPDSYWQSPGPQTHRRQGQAPPYCNFLPHCSVDYPRFYSLAV